MSLTDERRGSSSSSWSATSPTTSTRKELRNALYSGIFDKYRKTILIVGSFIQFFRKGQRNYGAIKSE